MEKYIVAQTAESERFFVLKLNEETEVYEEHSRWPTYREALEECSMRKRLGDEP